MKFWRIFESKRIKYKSWSRKCNRFWIFWIKTRKRKHKMFNRSRMTQFLWWNYVDFDDCKNHVVSKIRFEWNLSNWEKIKLNLKLFRFWRLQKLCCSSIKTKLNYKRNVKKHLKFDEWMNILYFTLKFQTDEFLSKQKTWSIFYE